MEIKVKSVYVFFLFLLMIIILTFPPVEAFPEFILIDTFFGTVSYTKFIIILTLFFSLFIIYFKRDLLEFKKNDLLMYLLCLLSIFSLGVISKTLYFFVIIFGGYTIGRVVGIVNLELKFLSALKMAGVIQSLLVIYTSYFGDIITSATTDTYLFGARGLIENGSTFLSHRAYGTIGHPVVLAAMLLPTTIITFYELITSRTKKQRFISSTLFVLCSYSLFITYSRGTWISLLITIFAILMRLGIIKRLKYWYLLIVILISIIFSPLGSDISQRFNQQDNSISHRLLMYEWTFNQSTLSIKSFLFGYGLDGGKVRLSENPPSDGLPVIDNIYLTIVINYGFFGLLLIFIVLFNTLKKGFNSHTKITIFSFILFSLTLNGFTFETFYWEQVGIIFWVLVGIIISLNSTNSESYNSNNNLYRGELTNGY